MSHSIPNRSQLLINVAKERILVLDGAMGTAIQAYDLTADDFGGHEYEGCNENLVLTRPDVIREIHEAHLKAGADILETNTFGGTPLVLEEYKLASQADALNQAACRIAREAADKYSTPEKPRFVAGSIGPTTKAISVTGGVTFEDLVENFYQQAKSLMAGGCDYFLVETCQDTRNIKAALIGIENLFNEKGVRIPVGVSATIEPMGTMLAGQGVEALIASLEHFDLFYLGLNCATGPEFMTDHLRTLAEKSPFPVSCVPNAGLPDEHGHYLETPSMVCGVMARFVEKRWLNFVGGCCGTKAEHIQALCKLVEGQPPHQSQAPKRTLLSGIEPLEITDEMRPLVVGERTNVIGSKKFKKLICEEKYDDASDVARSQVKGGAHLIDVCLANPDRNEFEDMKKFLEYAGKKVKVPFVIDSTDEKVIAMALTYCQGKALINSINLEDGEERFEKVVPLARQFGAALVVGTIDEDPEQGMGVTRARKLEIAARSYQLLTQKYGVRGSDIFWDPLVFPCGTGDEKYIGSAVETIEGIRLLKQHFPETKSILGISNVSFGLPAGGREVLNAVFLYHCVQAGLDLAIVNSEKLERYASIPEIERKLAEDLLWNRGDNPLQLFANHFREKKPLLKKDRSSLPLNERLSNYIIEGFKDGLKEDLTEALKSMVPLEIINGPLMAGMDEVGRLFNANKLIVAEVLQSAEAMKAAVGFLEPFMEKKDSSVRGKVVLATVKGDVHDIGKNLVEIIFSNNGFRVINLGIKVPPEQLIRAIQEHRPDIVGLSGLLVKSAQQMVTTAEDFHRAGVDTPILVGGAALSRNFVDRNIAKAYGAGFVDYANDAMHGLELAKTIVHKEEFQKHKGKVEARRLDLPQLKGVAHTPKEDPGATKRSPTVKILDTFPQPPDFERHVLVNNPQVDIAWKYINPMMLYGRHLGLTGEVVRLIEQMEVYPAMKARLQSVEPKGIEIHDIVQEMKAKYRQSEKMRTSGIYRFFRAYSEGNQIHLYEGEKKVQTFLFPRQTREPRLCLADYVHPDLNAGDTIALFAVTVGKGIRELAEELKNTGEYLRSHILQALALESAEGVAEYLHAQIRRMWGYPDPTDMTMLQRFQAKYHGKRYSFGYPACPNLSDQQGLFKLLAPEDIGVQLTDGDMMDPEASVTALVFHHPDAQYFAVVQP